VLCTNCFFVLHFMNGRFVLAIQPGNLCTHFFFSISIISRIFTFSLMERTSRLLLGLEALPASLLLCCGAIITVNMGLLNTNTVITRKLIRTARMLGAEWWQVGGEVWVQRQMKIVKYWAHLGCWILPWPVLAWCVF